MNIYIPDIKLPKDEPGAFQVIVMYVGADGKLRAECEGTHEVTIVPPHGRMIDADDLHSVLRKRAKEFSNSEYGEGVKCGLADAREYIKMATTIIPASGGQEDE